MRLTVRIPDEIHSYILKKCKSKNISMNEYINNLLVEDMNSNSNYANQLEIKRLLIELRSVLENQIKVIDENNKWNEVQTNMIYELLGVDKNE